LSQIINVPEVIKHAEVFYYIFRDYLISDAPAELGRNISDAVTSSTIENELSKISGITADIYIDQKKTRPSLTEEEWLEIIPVLEIDSAYAQISMTNYNKKTEQNGPEPPSPVNIDATISESSIVKNPLDKETDKKSF
jgi:hypothetical protein